MSADEIRRRAVDALNQARDSAASYSLNIRFRPSVLGAQFIPAMTAEEIALQLTEGNALTRAYTHAIELVNDAYRSMYESEEKKKPEQPPKEMY